MFNGFLRAAIPAALLGCAFAASDPTVARERGEMRVSLPSIGNQSWGNGVILRRERHVLERRPTGDGMFLMNGRWHQAAAGYCHRWAAGDRIKLRVGDWHGGPILVRNVARARSCGFWG